LVSVVPFVLRVGGVQLNVAEPVVDCDDTTIANAGSEAVEVPSLTLILMFEKVPVCALLGVPDSLPVVVLKAAQAGLLAMLKVSVLPSGSRAVGVNEYATPVRTEVGGVPEIVGGWLLLPEPVTVIENGGSEALPPRPSLTLMRMFEYVPMCAVVGTADSWQTVLLKTAHDGGFCTEHFSASPFGSEIVARKPYQRPALIVVGGVPEIVGGRFVPVGPVTVIENGGSDAVDLPSLTLILIFEYVPTCAVVGIADSWQTVLLKTAHDGWFWIEHFSASPSASEMVALKAYHTPALIDVFGVPEILGAAA
jgi:hypothetical protein